MSGTYGQFCPVAKAMDLLDERWTLLIIRELMSGSSHFNTMRRGVPRMSPALLSKRLSSLIRAGVVERHDDGARVTYRLTQAGHELRPIIELIGQWGTRWVPELGDADLDPHLLMWDMHRRIDLEAAPTGRTTVHFSFTETEPSNRDWWLVISDDGADVCEFDPGHEVRVTVSTSLRTMIEVWRGDIGWTQAIRTGQLEVTGDETARRGLPRWLMLSVFATVSRPEVRAGGVTVPA